MKSWFFQNEKKSTALHTTGKHMHLPVPKAKGQSLTKNSTFAHLHHHALPVVKSFVAGPPITARGQAIALQILAQVHARRLGSRCEAREGPGCGALPAWGEAGGDCVGVVLEVGRGSRAWVCSTGGRGEAGGVCMHEEHMRRVV
eukprot:1160804-Pelagomonas_calceolata.AAC.37